MYISPRKKERKRDGKKEEKEECADGTHSLLQGENEPIDGIVDGRERIMRCVERENGERVVRENSEIYREKMEEFLKRENGGIMWGELDESGVGSWRMYL